MKSKKINFATVVGQSARGLKLDIAQFSNFPKAGLFVLPGGVEVKPRYEGKEPVEGSVGSVLVTGADLLRAKRSYPFAEGELDVFEEEVEALQRFTLRFQKEQAEAFVTRFDALLEASKKESILIEGALVPELSYSPKGQSFDLTVHLSVDDFDSLEVVKAAECYGDWE